MAKWEELLMEKLGIDHIATFGKMEGESRVQYNTVVTELKPYLKRFEKMYTNLGQNSEENNNLNFGLPKADLSIVAKNYKTKKNLRDALFNGQAWELTDHTPELKPLEENVVLLQNIRDRLNTCYKNGHIDLAVDAATEVCRILLNMISSSPKIAEKTGVLKINGNDIKITKLIKNLLELNFGLSTYEYIDSRDRLQGWDLDEIMTDISRIVQEKRSNRSTVLWSTAANHMYEQSMGNSWTSCHATAKLNGTSGQSRESAWRVCATDYVTTIILIDRKKESPSKDAEVKKRIMVYVNTKDKLWATGKEYPKQSEASELARSVIDNIVRKKLNSLGYTELRIHPDAPTAKNAMDNNQHRNRFTMQPGLEGRSIHYNDYINRVYAEDTLDKCRTIGYIELQDTVKGE